MSKEIVLELLRESVRQSEMSPSKDYPMREWLDNGHGGIREQRKIRVMEADAVDGLIAALDDESWKVRRAAASLLGSSKMAEVSQSALPVLLAKINDETNKYVVKQFEATIRKLGGEVSNDPADKADVKQPKERRRVIKLLKEQDENQATQSLIEALQSNNPDMLIEMLKIVSAEDMKNPDITQHILPLLNHEYDVVRRLAIMKFSGNDLSRFNLNKQQLEQLLNRTAELTQDNDTKVRYSAFNVLGAWFGNKHGFYGTEAEEMIGSIYIPYQQLLIAGLEDEDINNFALVAGDLHRVHKFEPLSTDSIELITGKIQARLDSVNRIQNITKKRLEKVIELLQKS